MTFEPGEPPAAFQETSLVNVATAPVCLFVCLFVAYLCPWFSTDCWNVVAAVLVMAVHPHIAPSWACERFHCGFGTGIAPDPISGCATVAVRLAICLLLLPDL